MASAASGGKGESADGAGASRDSANVDAGTGAGAAAGAGVGEGEHECEFVHLVRIHLLKCARRVVCRCNYLIALGEGEQQTKGSAGAGLAQAKRGWVQQKLDREKETAKAATAEGGDRGNNDRCMGRSTSKGRSGSNGPSSKSRKTRSSRSRTSHKRSRRQFTAGCIEVAGG